MTALTISDIDAPLADNLRSRATSNGRTVEEEARSILQAAFPPDPPVLKGAQTNLADAIRSLFEPLGGVDLDLDWLRKQPSTRKPPEFE